MIILYKLQLLVFTNTVQLEFLHPIFISLHWLIYALYGQLILKGFKIV